MMASDRRTLCGWLRAEPQPHSLRIRTEDGETKTIELTEKARNRWKTAEAAIHAARAVACECLNKAGSILRSRTLEPEDEDAGPGDKDPVEAVRRKYERQVSTERQELAAVLDRYGDRMNEAFDRGAAAAGTSQENLVSLVEVLTTHLAHAITNLHNVSVNLANVVQATATGEDAPALGGQNGALLVNLLTQALAKGGGLGGNGTARKGESP